MTWTTIVGVPELAAALGTKNLVILDARHNLKDPAWGPQVFTEGHIPGAVHAHVDTDLSAPVTKNTGRHPMPDLDAFIETASRWGVDDSAQVVVYDDWGGAWASRAWWLLRYYGHAHVAVLDGGLPAWMAAGHPIEKGAAAARPRRRFVARPGAMPVVTAWDITTRSPRCLVDARAPARYRGDDEPVDPVGGHIPGAVNIPFAENTDKDGKFLPADQLRQKYESALAGRAPKDSAFYCGSGVTAPHDILAMEIAGLPGAALYPGSWSEWIRNPLRGVRKGGEP